MDCVCFFVSCFGFLPDRLLVSVWFVCVVSLLQEGETDGRTNPSASDFIEGKNGSLGETIIISFVVVVVVVAGKETIYDK